MSRFVLKSGGAMTNEQLVLRIKAGLDVPDNMLLV